MKLISRIFVLWGLSTLWVSSAFAGGDASRGGALLADTKTYACSSCHGPQFNNPIDPSYPKLAGQHYDYLVYALTSYKTADSAVMGRENPIMGVQAKNLSESEIRDIAAYLASLPEAVVTHK